MKISRETWKSIFPKRKSLFKCTLVDDDDDDDVCVFFFFGLQVRKSFFFLRFTTIWLGSLPLFHCSEIVYEDADAVTFSGYLKHRKVERWSLAGMLHSLTEKEHNTYRRLRNLEEIFRFNNRRTLPFRCTSCEWYKKIYYLKGAGFPSLKNHMQPKIIVRWVFS